VSYVSVNVGFAPQDIEATMRVLSSFRRQILSSPEKFLLATSVESVVLARRTGRLAVGFDLEDTNPLDGQIDLIQSYYDLGVRSMLMTYNGVNRAGHGCHDDAEGGLTTFGREVIEEMNRVGMIVDGSHCSYRTSMDAFEMSSQPVIFSHSSMRALWDHERNIRDDQALACAATGGVIGINGVGIFLGENDARTSSMARHIDYAAQLVGPEHVGVGTDYVFDNDDLSAVLAQQPELFPESYRRWNRLEFATPEQFQELPAVLQQMGYSSEDVRGIMGENFLRVAGEVWRSPSGAFDAPAEDG
jgi:membrane dipeptidase